MTNVENTLTGNPELVDPGFSTPPKNPIELLRKWLKLAKALNIAEPNALVLSSVDKNNKPSSRVVLLKECTDSGVTFGSSSLSQKGQDFEMNQWVSGNLWWRETMQQINFQGTIKTLSKEFSDKMFKDRTDAAKAVAIASTQSSILENASALSDRITSVIQGNNLERPSHWHAFHIEITSIEFWHGSKDRMHKRLKYDLTNASIWSKNFLQP